MFTWVFTLMIHTHTSNITTLTHSVKVADLHPDISPLNLSRVRFLCSHPVFTPILHTNTSHPYFTPHHPHHPQCESSRKIKIHVEHMNHQCTQYFLQYMYLKPPTQRNQEAYDPFVILTTLWGVVSRS